ncbi:hypothetical protein COW36_16730 [bacterium (Candidatus Blackallbacteria) CG17_big_fil_post_rev_8_21_14_2_50_48_46]|uniref:O-GlcNAc transferase C-terminal domain-containing protein n=1 Tax=bacterium (Candidatus Blackallbacteria) CG17_big_fil_post_rev_8_21_14_2_50_48_46 TaxID=2014261 RepID=A0A2M7G1L3_9BACT|nr:MAG: hypothetical protein COW64_08265 [bacterium (Candidatus Blackallbacteria) CG18_big_fil_WC_8_21_14_2_50_49_26]PIW15594.1 MAG: hypothetical protein COW36_16730 [bacterium (Candidatus Blackallbacteria) CG17_big_fil_post_rev_8_21_14_2_50_48_46]PIW49385.1 MAG: hypothetical protein COW20_06160 [bacterium (Candidatus Blackallbacteria) CG13_big_fil_rev_8_21_14_2_50_49_14]
MKPEETEAQLQKALHNLKAGKFQEAEQELQTLLQSSSHPGALLLLSSLKLSQNQVQLAIQLCLQALQIAPEDPDVHYSLGLAYYAHQEVEPALTHLRQATALNPKHTHALLRMGQIYLRHGLPFHAFACLEQGQGLLPEQAVDARAFSLAAWLCGFFEPFQSWIQRYFKQLNSPPLQLEVWSRYLDLLASQSEVSDQTLETQRLQIQWPEWNQPPSPPKRSEALLKLLFLLSASKAPPTPLLEECKKSQRWEIQVLYAESPQPGTPLVWRTEQTQQAIDPVAFLQTQPPNCILDLCGPELSESLQLAPYAPQTVWLKGLEAENGIPEIKPIKRFKLSHNQLCDKNSCLPLLWTDSLPELPVLPFPQGAPVAGYAGPLRYLSNQTLSYWGDLLLHLPDLRLCLFTQAFDDPLMRQYIEQVFQRRGISSYRLRFWGACTSQEPLRFFHQQIHLALAPFPQNSLKASCQALWLGRPLLTLNHPNWEQRNAAAAVLNTLELREWVCTSQDEFLTRAENLIAHPPEGTLLREKLQNSSLLNRKNWIDCFDHFLKRESEDHAA